MGSLFFIARSLDKSSGWGYNKNIKLHFIKGEKMKKIFAIIASVLLLCATMVLFTACGHTHEFTLYEYDGNATYEADGTKTAICNVEGCNETDTITAAGTKLQGYVSFKTFTVEGDHAYCVVANSEETFSFLDEIETTGDVTYMVTLDVFGASQALTKIVPLSVGDNTVYLFELHDGEVSKKIEVTIRRRPTYSVYFNSNGGTSVQSQTVEEGFLSSEPTAPTRTGYTFDGWEFDFSTPITGYTTINAKWKANTDTAYKVEYYLENIENDNYTLQEQETENLTGTTDTTANAEIKVFNHFTPESLEVTGNIAPDGSTVLRVYYQRNEYAVTFDGNGGELYRGNAEQRVKYGGAAVAPIYEKIGFYISGWSVPLVNISSDITTIASWTKVNASDYVVRDGDYIEFGSYPQTIKADNVTVGTVANEQGYYTGSDGELYAKVVVVNRYSSRYKFSNDQTVTYGNTYYFKVEPIRWRILSESDGKALILCDSIIANKRFDDESNNYKQSEIREWLNNEFLSTAFSEMERALINVVTVDNSAAEGGDTRDKAFLLSYSDVNNAEYGFLSVRYDEDNFVSDEKKQMLTSDYSRATGAGMSTSSDYYGNGQWWLGPPDSSYSYYAGYVDINGYVYDDYHGCSVYATDNGVVPALQIQLG